VKISIILFTFVLLKSNVKMKKIILGFLVLVSIVACKTSNASLGEVVKKEGENFKAVNVQSYDQLLAKLEKEEKVEDIVVEGKVTNVCQSKGCWMTLVSTANADTPPIFVKFKDYAFFMPLDLAGGRVIMKGSAFKEVTSVDELKHYAEDEGKSKEEIAKITMPKEELKFMASGVQILKYK
jgi:hypothetical protein